MSLNDLLPFSTGTVPPRLTLSINNISYLCTSIPPYGLCRAKLRTPSNGWSVDCVLQGQQVVVRVFSGEDSSVKAAVALPNIELHAWSWICVVLEKKAFWRSVAKVYLNGRHVGDHTLPYPPPSGMSKTGAGNHHNLSPMMMIYIKSIFI